jgi:hypothetical protein
VIEYHIDTPSDLYSVLRRAGATWGRPVRRILHLLLRKAMLKTLYVEQSPPSADLDKEIEVYSHLKREGCVRLHFFAARIEDPDQIRSNNQSYCGYCDIRSDGTIARCNISRHVIIRPDTYAYLVCQTSEAIKLPTGDQVSVTGFSHVEKNRRGLMCSQAAVANVVHYWNAKRAGSFLTTTAVDISRAAGVSDEELREGNFKGLTGPAVSKFFEKQGFHCFMGLVSHKDKPEQGKADAQIDKTQESPIEAVKAAGELRDDIRKPGESVTISEQDAAGTIYGFLESGFPVIAVVRTKNESLHALTVVGHTLDKNVWLAFAEPFYFDEPLTGGGGYHSNLAWIRYFIVQDDNLGPYFFVPRVNLASIIQAIIVPLPYANIVIIPRQAERAAFKGLAQLISSPIEADKRIIGANRRWLDILKSHFDPREAEGWVLRPYFKLKDQVIDLFSNHEFGPVVAARVKETTTSGFWVVELSWPNLYCYDEHKAGEVLIDAATGNPWLIHIPGLLAFSSLDKVEFAASEDPPRYCLQGSLNSPSGIL